MVPKVILLIEDDDSGRELGLFNLRRAGYRAEGAASGEEGLERFDPELHELVITDVRMPGTGGLEVLAQITEATGGEVPVIVITAYGDVELAVRAMRLGAADFIGKPFNRDHLLLAVERALARRQLEREVVSLRIQATGIERPIIHASTAMVRVLEIADRLAGSSSPALITGESGTGKELIARRIHVRSGRAAGPFVVVHGPAIAGERAEIELFGDADHRGRVRQAQGGTLFLDGLSELSPSVQGKLLRVVEEGIVSPEGGAQEVALDCRILAAIRPEARAALRDDLLYRLAVVELQVPPLRERTADILPLCVHFVRRFSGDRELGLPPELIEAMRQRPWPGNVRELENACERLVLLRRAGTLELGDLPPLVEREPGESDPDRGDADGLESFLATLPEQGLSLVDLERRVIERALEHKRWNVSQAALYLKIPRHVLAYRMEKYGIRRPG